MFEIALWSHATYSGVMVFKLETFINEGRGNVCDKERNAELRLAFFIESTRALTSYEIETHKSLLMLSGGASVALLTFMGHLIGSGKMSVAQKMAFPLLILIFSCFITSVSIFLNSLAQRKYADELAKPMDFTQENKSQRNEYDLLASLSIVCSYVICAIGIIWGIYLFLMN